MSKTIDIHSHVIWDVDDGARTEEEAIELCKIAAEKGTHTLFLTPHLMYWVEAEDLYDETMEKAEYLREVLEEEGINLVLKTGFEILCDDEIFDVDYFKPYTLCGSRYLLIEFDFFKTSAEDVIAWCSYLISYKVVPIIAHPERYNFTKLFPEVVDKLSDMGVLFQLNTGSLDGSFGSDSRSFAVQMLENGYADFIASDAHMTEGRNTDINGWYDTCPYSLSPEESKRIFCDNPQSVIDDTEIIPKRKKRFV